MKRAITLTLLVLLSVGILVPLTANWSAEASRAKVTKRKKLKKYSRAWWRQYHARVRRNRQIAARKRESIAMQRAAQNGKMQIVPVVDTKTAAMNQTVAGWTGESVTPNGEARFRVNDQAGNQIGSAQLAVVAAALPEPNPAEMPAKMRDKLLSGVSISSLRRAVIDRMIREEGWIVNDFQQEIQGKKVFVIVGQTAKGGAVSSRLFYFTEIDGRIYSLSTSAPENFQDKLAADAEQFIEKLQRGNRTQEVTASTSIQ